MDMTAATTRCLYARRWAQERGQATAAAFVPLSFAPGEAYQFDWSHEIVLLERSDGDREGRLTFGSATAAYLFVRAYPT